MIKRYFLAFNFAALITFSLFFAMQMLIANDEIVLLPSNQGTVVILGKARPPEEILPKHEVPKKQEIEVAPVIPRITVEGDPDNVITIVDITEPTIGNPFEDKFSTFSNGEGEYLPIVRVAPQYPGPLAEKGIEGFVSLSFTVTEFGTVKDITIVESSHRGFERAAIKAVEKFKYKPRIVDGEAVPAIGVTTKLDFRLDNS